MSTPNDKAVAFTLKNPSTPLAFVLSEYRDSFFHFLLTGNTRPATAARMRTAIDLVLNMIADQHGCSVTDAQYYITPATTEGMQNLTVIRFFTHCLQDTPDISQAWLLPRVSPTE